MGKVIAIDPKDKYGYRVKEPHDTCFHLNTCCHVGLSYQAVKTTAAFR